MRVEKHYLQWVTNSGNGTLAQFDDDFEPAGPMVRKIMSDDGLAEIRDGRMYLTEAGQKAAT